MTTFGGFLNNPLVSITEDRNGKTVVQLFAPLPFVVDQGTHAVPAGFQSDGASIPRAAWFRFGHPFERKVIRPGIMHDWLYRIEADHPSKHTRAEADRLFYEALRWCGVNRVKAWCMWKAVVLFGESHFNRASTRKVA